jgi:hypothetical protein
VEERPEFLSAEAGQGVFDFDGASQTGDGFRGVGASDAFPTAWRGRDICGGGSISIELSVGWRHDWVRCLCLCFGSCSWLCEWENRGEGSGRAGEMGGKLLVIVQAGIGSPSHERVWSCVE